MDRQPRLLVLTTSDATMGSFFSRQLAFFANEGFHVLAVSSPGPGLEKVRDAGPVEIHPLAMERRPNPLRDLASLAAIRKVMRRFRPHIVHAHTPKAGLLGMMAATSSRVPVRLYTIHGLPLLTRTGWRRASLKFPERISCALSTRTYCVSPSVAGVVREMKLCSPRKLFTPGDGSCSGVDLDHFDPAVDALSRRESFRRAHGIPFDAFMLCYIGRVAKDKGIEILASAWTTLAPRFPHLHLVLCGTLDHTDPVSEPVMQALRNDTRVHLTEKWFTSEDMPAVYAATDLCVLPTYREGLPQVAIECGAMQVPIVGTRIPGMVSAVQDGVTALLVPPGEPAPLAEAIARLLQDEPLRRQLGEAGREFVQARFSEHRVNHLYIEEYRSLLRAASRWIPTLQLDNVRKP
jgi:glycosyltransferase involved in cell wall biosynthesis